MKRPASYKLLPLLPVGTGGIALILRLALYTMKNESGLLPHNHPLYIATLILAVATALIVGFFVFRLDGSSEYSVNFPDRRACGFGALFAGLWLIRTAFTVWESSVIRLDDIWTALAFGAVVCFITVSILSLKGKQPHFALFFFICLYFAIHMVCRYREWSGNPQVEDYIFSVFGCIFLSLFSYHRAAFTLGSGRRRMLLFSGMMAMFFCLPMIIHGNDREFFLAGFIWAGTNLCVIDPPPKTEGKEGNDASA